MTKEDIMKPENLVYQKPTLLNDNPMHYCPGCSHGVVHKLVAEVIEEMGMTDKTIGISPVGCAVFMYNYLDVDCLEAAHGRAPALAGAIKRLWPDRLVFTYQGDGDLACIGTAETIHSLNRGDNITIIFINNAIYGMTGGQMAPTTLVGMKTSTCPYGRNPEIHGYPLKMTEIAATLRGTCYVTRQSVHTVAAIRKAKKAIRKAFENSMQGKGSNLVEIVSTCSSGWKMTPEAANKWMEENMFPFYPLGDLKDTTGDK
ncbi:thiamine pyrophosphate-dependent enzyme [Bacteroides ilei]|jgi:2-oxoglutarate ferredoxin oxidoreductase subunit beta|uniref:thiamine pyrophosphate-dependent enzyme n=1 Tax=Bacteroides ilei TaxID=1907658 RepID=UPI0009305B40|nr:thiamine pyrophosphate-dependent enzyme [Bacteroides ilei]